MFRSISAFSLDSKKAVARKVFGAGLVLKTNFPGRSRRPGRYQKKRAKDSTEEGCDENENACRGAGNFCSPW